MYVESLFGALCAVILVVIAFAGLAGLVFGGALIGAGIVTGVWTYDEMRDKHAQLAQKAEKTARDLRDARAAIAALQPPQ